MEGGFVKFMGYALVRRRILDLYKIKFLVHDPQITLFSNGRTEGMAYEFRKPPSVPAAFQYDPLVVAGKCHRDVAPSSEGSGRPETHKAHRGGPSSSDGTRPLRCAHNNHLCKVLELALI